MIRKMLYCDRLDVPEGIDDKSTNTSLESIICHYCFFLKMLFRFQSTICNGYDNILMMSIDITRIVISNIHGADYRLHYQFIKKW